MVERKRQSVCERVNALRSPPAAGSKVGVALRTLGRTPVHGLRHPPTDATSGWYLWCGGEIADDPDFFVPLHVEHLAAYLPSVVEYLDLPPGYRFLVDGAEYEDVWFDAALLSPQ